MNKAVTSICKMTQNNLHTAKWPLNVTKYLSVWGCSVVIIQLVGRLDFSVLVYILMFYFNKGLNYVDKNVLNR